MKARLVCRSIRSMSWVVKKASVQLEVTCDEHGVTLMTSKSSFHLEEPERRISRGYFKGGRPKSTYLCIYWLGVQSVDIK